MGDLTKNLSRHEFACRCGCGFDTADFETVNMLQGTVNYFERKYQRDIRIDITGPNRCKRHNDQLRELWRSTDGKQGANTSQNSQHIFARAADFKLFFRDANKQVPADEVHEYLDNQYGAKIALGRYVGRCHGDTRTNAGQRW